MLSFFARRLTSLALSLTLASALIFCALEWVPGDPAQFMLGINAQPDTIAALRRDLGLEGDLLTRYVNWIGGMMRGDFGTSYTYRTPVSEMLAGRLRVSLPLAVMALSLAIGIAIPAGLLAARHRGRAPDITIMSATQIGVAIPNFWFAMILVLIFAIKLRWFSAGGFPGWTDPIAALKALTLPAIALALPQAAILARVTRSALIDIMAEDFMRTARAKGLSQRAAIWRHALPNALIPVLTIMGLQFSFLLAGAIIIEQVFFLPGLGRMIFQAITQRDLIVVESAVMVLVFAVILVNFMVEIAYGLVDPRVRARRH